MNDDHRVMVTADDARRVLRKIDGYASLVDTLETFVDQTERRETDMEVKHHAEITAAYEVAAGACARHALDVTRKAVEKARAEGAAEERAAIQKLALDHYDINIFLRAIASLP